MENTTFIALASRKLEELEIAIFSHLRGVSEMGRCREIGAIFGSGTWIKSVMPPPALLYSHRVNIPLSVVTLLLHSG